MIKLNFGDEIEIKINGAYIIAKVVSITTRENSREIVTYYTFEQVSDENVHFSLDVTELKKMDNEND